jgi:phosphatidylglycerophosphate synthase
MNKLKKEEIIKYSDFISNYFYQQIAFFLTQRLYTTKITPNQITFISLLLGLSSAIETYFGHKIAAIVLLNLSFILDCVDGQLARAKNKSSSFGMWLDNISDRVVENSILLALVLQSEKIEFIKAVTFLIFLNMFYAYMSDIAIYQNIRYRKLNFYEKIIFSPLYFISRSMIIPMLSILILFPMEVVWLLLIFYVIGIIFRLYREINGRIDEY